MELDIVHFFHMLQMDFVQIVGVVKETLPLDVGGDPFSIWLGIIGYIADELCLAQFIIHSANTLFTEHTIFTWQ